MQRKLCSAIRHRPTRQTVCAQRIDALRQTLSRSLSYFFALPTRTVCGPFSSSATLVEKRKPEKLNKKHLGVNASVCNTHRQDRKSINGLCCSFTVRNSAWHHRRARRPCSLTIVQKPFRALPVQRRCLEVFLEVKSWETLQEIFTETFCDFYKVVQC